MANLGVNFLGIDFKNRMVTASGAYGYGREYESLYPLSELGGISTKGTTLKVKDGNPPPKRRCR